MCTYCMCVYMCVCCLQVELAEHCEALQEVITKGENALLPTENDAENGNDAENALAELRRVRNLEDAFVGNIAAVRSPIRCAKISFHGFSSLWSSDLEIADSSVSHLCGDLRRATKNLPSKTRKVNRSRKNLDSDSWIGYLKAFRKFHTLADTHTRTRAHTHVRTHARARTYNTYTYTHTHIHTQSHTHTHHKRPKAGIQHVAVLITWRVYAPFLSR